MPRRPSGQAPVDWLKGGGFLIFHIDVFLVAIAALLLLNIARSPDHIWVTGVFWRWGLLLLIHGMVTALIWLIGMLLREERPGAGTYEAEWSSTPQEMNEVPTVEPVELVAPDDATERWSASQGDAADVPRTSPEEIWSAPEPAPSTADDWYAGVEERTSWAETSTSNWLARRRRERNAAADQRTEQSQDGA